MNTNTNNIFNNAQVISEYTGTEKEITLPEGVKRIKAGAFKNNKDIVSVQLPNTLEYIGDEAFSGCTSLKAVLLNSKAPAASIGKAAFKGCTALEKLTVNGVKTVGDEAFTDCSALGYLNGFNGCEELGCGAFRNCTSLEFAVLPESVAKMGADAFANCTKLKELFIPMIKNIDEDHSKYFSGCTAIERRIRCLKAPEPDFLPGVVEKDTLVQFDDTDIDCLRIPGYIKTVAAGAFKGCKNLRLVIIPDTLDEIEEGAFDECPNLEDVIIPDDWDIIDQYSLSDTKWFSDNKDNCFVLGGTLLGHSFNNMDIIVPPTAKRVTDDELRELINASRYSITLPSTFRTMTEIPNGSVTGPSVSVYNVVPGSSVF